MVAIGFKFLTRLFDDVEQQYYFSQNQASASTDVIGLRVWHISGVMSYTGWMSMAGLGSVHSGVQVSTQHGSWILDRCLPASRQH